MDTQFFRPNDEKSACLSHFFTIKKNKKNFYLFCCIVFYIMYNKSIEREDLKVKHTKKSIVERFASKLIVAKGHDKKAYSVGYKLAYNLPENALLDIRETKQGAFNIGDLGEAFAKMILENANEGAVSSKGRKDIARRYFHEVKTFSSANRNPNGFIKPIGFVAICELGAYKIKSESIANRWDLLKDNKGLKEISLAILKDIIENDNPERLHDLSAKMLGE